MEIKTVFVESEDGQWQINYNPKTDRIALLRPNWNGVRCMTLGGFIDKFPELSAEALRELFRRSNDAAIC